jgi:hypothetical protein
MNLFKLIVSFIILFPAHNSWGCDCKELGPLKYLRTLSIQNSHLIFLGELLTIDTSTASYSLKIIELFKGEITDSIINGRYYDSCSLVPNGSGKWIIYAKFREDSFIEISSCLASRSDLDPICINCYYIKPPLSYNSTKTEHHKIEIAEFVQKAKQDWKEEVIYLRNLKDK